MADLTRASRIGDEQAVRRLLAAGADPDVANRYGLFPLHFAAVDGYEAIVRLLLAAGANPNVRAARDGSTPLHDAAANDHEAIVQLLLAFGADPTLRTKRGRTPARVTRTPELRALLEDAEYVWTHSWNPEEHARWTEAQRLERVGALSAFRTRTGRRIVIPELPRELQFAVFEHL